MKQKSRVIDIGEFPPEMTFIVDDPLNLYMDSLASDRDAREEYPDEWSMIQIDAEIEREKQ